MRLWIMVLIDLMKEIPLFLCSRRRSGQAAESLGKATDEIHWSELFEVV